MANYSNAQILAAVINKWAAPLTSNISMQTIAKLPMLQALENKIKSSGWASPQWSIAQELSPLMSNAASVVLEPVIANYLSGIPDNAIPQMIHSMVDSAIAKGQGLSLMEGKLTFTNEDLRELKKYLDWNLPLDSSPYQVKTN